MNQHRLLERLLAVHVETAHAYSRAADGCDDEELRAQLDVFRIEHEDAVHTLVSSVRSLVAPHPRTRRWTVTSDRKRVLRSLQRDEGRALRTSRAALGAQTAGDHRALLERIVADAARRRDWLDRAAEAAEPRSPDDGRVRRREAA